MEETIRLHLLPAAERIRLRLCRAGREIVRRSAERRDPDE